MHTAERLTGTISGHRKAIACLSGALVLAGAGTASAATAAPAGRVAITLDAAPVAVRDVPAHADTTLRAGVVAVVAAGSPCPPRSGSRGPRPIRPRIQPAPRMLPARRS